MIRYFFCIMARILFRICNLSLRVCSHSFFFVSTSPHKFIRRIALKNKA